MQAAPLAEVRACEGRQSHLNVDVARRCCRDDELEFGATDAKLPRSRAFELPFLPNETNRLASYIELRSYHG